MSVEFPQKSERLSVDALQEFRAKLPELPDKKYKYYFQAVYDFNAQLEEELAEKLPENVTVQDIVQASLLWHVLVGSTPPAEAGQELTAQADGLRTWVEEKITAFVKALENELFRS